ncbi:ikappab kinase complex-associated protein, putative, partial [Ixodes scapularis]
LSLLFQAEVVGNVSGGILAMQWSPDYELVVVVSGEEKVLLMTKDFDPVSEKSLHPDEFGECSPITAGWGSKETQFHGSEGKQAAKVEVKVASGAQSLSVADSSTFGGPGCFSQLRVAAVRNSNRKLRIWSREGALQYTGEDINGLEQALSWKPSGSLIASSQHLPNKHKIIFFEKNGLNHGEFQLPFAPREFEVKELSWCTDSSVLAVVGSTFQTDDCAVLPKDMVLLYTVNNYHWYLKQTLEYDAALGQKLAAVAWDEGSALRLHVLCTSGSYYRYTWSHAVHAGPSVSPEGAAVVAVIDADRVLTTPFRTTVVPPPMCCYKVRTGVSVDQVAFGVKRRRDEFFVVLQNGKRILFVLHDGDGIQLELPKPCRTVAVCEVLKQPRVLGLSDRFELFCDVWRICDNCTSFRVHGKFLLLTTHAHTLRCLLLDYDLPSILNGNPSASLDDSPRQLERGSLLVTSVLADGRVVLQLPRGNLETISPRALVLDRMCEHLDRIEFKKAFLLMKVHRINLNLLCDHDPAAFLEHLEEFVSQIGNFTDINLFLTELSDQDVANTLYASAYRSRSKKPFRFERSKNDHVCDALRDVLERLDYDRFLLSILTCHAKKSEPELDQALFKIHKLKGVAEEQGTTLDQALKYILYLVDTNDLFNVALGTYNFDLVLMVAEKSQKDPKEYVPFLNELNKLELNYRRFKIDLHLGRHEKALRNISLCGKCESHFEECLNLIKSQRLFTSALYLFPEGSDQYKEVWGIYGDYLLQKKHYEEAGLVYQRCGKLEKALTAFELCLNWSLLLSVAHQLDYAQDKLQSLARRVTWSKHVQRLMIVRELKKTVDQGDA